jgi:AmmeMemoRadiSam system protein B
MVRRPAAAGYFYPKRADELKSLVKGMVDPRAEKEKARAVVSPHAGFIYSGPVAGAVYSSVILPQRFVILGPSHRGQRSLFAIMDQGAWRTPLGEVPLDSGLAESLLRHSALIKADEAPMRRSILGSQLPFLQYQAGLLHRSPHVSPIAILRPGRLGTGWRSCPSQNGRPHSWPRPYEPLRQPNLPKRISWRSGGCVPSCPWAL